MKHCRWVAAAGTLGLALLVTSVTAQEPGALRSPAGSEGPTPRSAPRPQGGTGAAGGANPVASVTANQCAAMGGSCNAANDCVVFRNDPEGGLVPVVEGTCSGGDDGGGPIGGGSQGGGPVNNCVDGINSVSYSGFSVDCGKEGERCIAACRNASTLAIRRRCSEACTRVNLNCCTGEDPIRQQCTAPIGGDRRRRCATDREKRDVACGTDPGTINGLPRSIQDCLQASRLREGDCCSGLVEPES